MSNRNDGLFAFLLGAVVGAAVGLLYAPKTGKETRAHLKQLGEDFVDSAEDFGEEVKVKGKKLFAEGKAKVSEVVEKGKNSLKSKKSSVVEPVVEPEPQEDSIV